MKKRWLLPIVLTCLLVFLVFVPAIDIDAGGIEQSCSVHTGCVRILNFGSLTYAYGGWGSVFQTGVNDYFISGWVCSCPIDLNFPCCVPPFAWLIWPFVFGMIIVILVSTRVFMRLGDRGQKKKLNSLKPSIP